MLLRWIAIALGVVMCLVILFWAYVRFRYRFWASQPVYHIYDLFSKDKGILQPHKASSSKHLNRINIRCLRTDTVSDALQQRVTNFLRTHYNPDYYFPTSLTSFFQGHGRPCYWSFYTKKNDNDCLLGIITTRPLHLQLRWRKETLALEVSYVDFLCVDALHRRTGIAQQLIETHDYYQRQRTPEICVSLFKREGVLNPTVVPLTVLTNNIFCMHAWSSVPPLPPEYRLLAGDKQNMVYVHSFLKTNTSAFEVIAIPSVSNLIEQTKANQIFVQCLMQGTDILAVYMFRKTCVYMKPNRQDEVICLFASVQGDDDDALFVHGFRCALADILQKQKKGCAFGYLAIEEIAHNGKLRASIRTPPSVKNLCAYYFYNFAFHTVDASKCLIVQ